jgi:hypothetical protein
MPQTFKLDVTFDEMAAIKEGLVTLRDRQYLSGDVEHYVKYSWAIKDAEACLTKRAQIADTVYRLFGERLDENPEYAATIAEAKRLKAELEALEAEEAADA